MTDEAYQRAINKVCWSVATTAESFYPPEETARGCMESLEDVSDETWDKQFAWEQGQHTRAIMEAEQVFKTVAGFGIDPQHAAVTFIKESDADLPMLDWAWIDWSTYDSADYELEDRP